MCDCVWQKNMCDWRTCVTKEHVWLKNMCDWRTCVADEQVTEESVWQKNMCDWWTCVADGQMRDWWTCASVCDRRTYVTEEHMWLKKMCDWGKCVTHRLCIIAGDDLLERSDGERLLDHEDALGQVRRNVLKYQNKFPLPNSINIGICSLGYRSSTSWSPWGRGGGGSTIYHT